MTFQTGTFRTTLCIRKSSSEYCLLHASAILPVFSGPKQKRHPFNPQTAYKEKGCGENGAEGD
jgi:hypothetical protein